MFVMGLEGSFNLGNTKKKVSQYTDSRGNTYKGTVKRDVAFGLATRLGIAIDSIMLYTKLGWEVANMNHNIKKNNNNTNFVHSKNKLSHGFVMGGGVSKVFNNGIMLGGEYTYTRYQKVHFRYTGGEDTLSPRIHDFKVRLGYKF